MPRVRRPGVYVQIKLKRGNKTSWLKGKSDKPLLVNVESTITKKHNTDSTSEM